MESDEAGTSPEISDETILPIKEHAEVKKVLSPAKMEALAKARIAAAEKKKALGEITKREKALKEKILEDRIKQLNKMEEVAKTKWIKFDELENAYHDNTGHIYKSLRDIPKGLRDKIVESKKRTAKTKVIQAQSDNSSASSESESESDSEDEVRASHNGTLRHSQRKKRSSAKTKSHLSNEVVRENLKQKILRDNYKAAFASLFPGHLNIYES
jgi:hypothetical protein